VVFSVTSFLSAKESILNLFKKDDSMRESIFNILIIITLVNCTGIPVLAWIDTPKFVQYLHKWEQFQVGNNWEFLEFCFNSKLLNFWLVLFQQYEDRNS